MKFKLISVLVSILLPITCFAQQPVAMQQAKIELSNYERMISSGGAGKSAYDAAYKAVQGYSKAIKDLSSSSSEYAECRMALRDLFSVMSDGAYYYAGLGMQDKVLQFACAFIDISLLSAFSDAGLHRAQTYPTLANLAATNLFNGKEYERAIEYFKAYLNTSDIENREFAFEGLARCYYEMKDYGWASYIASQGVTYYPTNWNMLIIGIESYGQTGHDDKMEPLLTQALSLSPGHKGLLEYQGKMYERQKKFDQAAKTFSQLFKINDSSLDYALHLGFNLYNAGSVALYDSKKPGIPSSESNALSNKAKQYFTQAAPVLKLVLDNSPYAANVARALALCYAATNDNERLKQANQSLTALRVSEVANSEIPMLDLSYRPMVELNPVQNSDMATLGTPNGSNKPLSDVDINIPETGRNNSKTYAVIIANENYMNKEVPSVPYAKHDGEVFAEYCRKVLGIPKDNIQECYDATFSQIREKMNYLANRTKINPDELNIIFYYSGHGTLDYTDRSSYLLPVDASGTDMASCIALNSICDQFDEMPARKVTMFLDACFTGETRSEERIIKGARYVTYDPEDVVAKGNTVVFCATAEKQVSLPYDEQGHGFFTYFLLKSLQETKGNISYKDLADSLRKNVDAKALDKRNKNQTPTVNASAALGSSWHSFTFF